MTPMPVAASPRARRAPSRLALGLLVCLLLYGIDLACVAAAPAAGLSFASNFALPFDLMVCVPAAFYLLVVRRAQLSPLLALPAVWLGGLVSARFVDPGQPSILPLLGVATLAVEAVVAVREIRRFVGGYRAARAASDNPLDWFTAAFCVLVRNERAARVAGLECTMWYYAAASWRRAPHVPAGYRAFSSHRQSGYVAVVGVLLGLVAVETFAVHLMAARFSVPAACALTALSAYTAAWMVAETRAVVLNPLLVGNGELVARWGMLACERVPLDLIARVGADEPAVPKRERLDLAAMGGQAVWIELSAPLEVRGVLGKPRSVRALKTTPDDAAAFKQALRPLVRGRI